MYNLHKITRQKRFCKFRELFKGYFGNHLTVTVARTQNFAT